MRFERSNLSGAGIGWILETLYGLHILVRRLGLQREAERGHTRLPISLEARENTEYRYQKKHGGKGGEKYKKGAHYYIKNK